MKLSVIIPVLNEQENILRLLPGMDWLKAAGHELIVVDGGSTDSSLDYARSYASCVISAARGRARQMNAGARVAQGDVLVFLHMDTLLNTAAIDELCDRLSDSPLVWGRYDVRLSGRDILFRLIESMMNWRSRLTAIATGDQAIFVRKDTFSAINGYADIPLMEDIEISRRLKKISKPLCLSSKVITSSRRWEDSGILRTVVLMWRLRLAYWWGVKPIHLVKRYYPRS